MGVAEGWRAGFRRFSRLRSENEPRFRTRAHRADLHPRRRRGKPGTGRSGRGRSRCEHRSPLLSPLLPFTLDVALSSVIAFVVPPRPGDVAMSAMTRHVAYRFFASLPPFSPPASFPPAFAQIPRKYLVNRTYGRRADARAISARMFAIAAFSRPPSLPREPRASHSISTGLSNHHRARRGGGGFASRRRRLRKLEILSRVANSRILGQPSARVRRILVSSSPRASHSFARFVMWGFPLYRRRGPRRKVSRNCSSENSASDRNVISGRYLRDKREEERGHAARRHPGVG